MCRHSMEKLEQTISQKPQANRQPLHSTSHKELKKHIYIYIYIHKAKMLNKIIYKLTTNTTGDRKLHKSPRQGTENATKTRKS